MRKISTLLAILGVFVPTVSVGGELPETATRKAIVQEALTAAPMNLTLRHAIDREAVRLRVATPSRGNLLLQPPGPQRQGWIGRHRVLFAALVGAGGGAVSAATMQNELFCSGGDEDCFFHGGSRVLVGAGMGAGVGALVGWLVGLGNR